MSPKNLWSKGTIVLFLGIFFYILLGLSSEFSDLLSAFSQINFWYYSLTFVLFTPMFFIQSIRYHIILKQLGIETSFKNSILVHFSSLTMLITPGAAGSILKSILLKKKTGNSISSTVPVIFFERWLELTSITIIIGLLLFWSISIESIIIFTIGISLVSIFLIILKYSPGISFLNKLLIKTKILKKYVIDELDFQKTTQIMVTPKNTASLLSLSLISKIFPILSVYLIFQLFDLNLDIFQTSQIYFVGQLIGALSFIPGGILITETSLLGLMLNSNVNFTISSVIVLLIRILTFWFPILLGFIILRNVIKNH